MNAVIVVMIQIEVAVRPVMIMIGAAEAALDRRNILNAIEIEMNDGVIKIEIDIVIVVAAAIEIVAIVMVIIKLIPVQIYVISFSLTVILNFNH